MTESVELITAPESLPVPLEEVKEHLRLEQSFADEDVYIQSLIESATEYAQVQLDDAQLITATYDWHLDRFPGALGVLCVPRPPLQSVTSIQYQDDNDVQQTLSSSLYVVDAKHKPARITPAYGETWPSTYLEMNAVTVRFIAGYGDTPDKVPARVRHALKVLVAHWYEERQPVAFGPAVKIPVHLEQLFWSSRIGSYA